MTNESNNPMEVVAFKARRRLIPASIEISAKQAVESSDVPELFPQGTRVYIPDVGADDMPTLVSAARRLADLGYIAVPHIVARRLTTRAALEDRISAISQEAGVRDVLLLGGDLPRPAGEFASSMDVLEAGLLDKYDFTDIGVAGHPEGSRDFTDEVALEALRLKQAFGQRTGAKVRIVTQFGFDAARFIEWTDGLQGHGIDLPVHLGVAGPARITTLLKYAVRCGVGNSLNFLKKRAASLATLASGYSPESMVEPVERHVREKPASAIAQIHVFPFGGLKNAANWLEERGSWDRNRPAAQSQIA